MKDISYRHPPSPSFSLPVSPSKYLLTQTYPSQRNSEQFLQFYKERSSKIYEIVTDDQKLLVSFNAVGRKNGIQILKIFPKYDSNRVKALGDDVFWAMDYCPEHIK